MKCRAVDIPGAPPYPPFSGPKMLNTSTAMERAVNTGFTFCCGLECTPLCTALMASPTVALWLLKGNKQKRQVGGIHGACAGSAFMCRSNRGKGWKWEVMRCCRSQTRSCSWNWRCVWVCARARESLSVCVVVGLTSRFVASVFTVGWFTRSPHAVCVYVCVRARVCVCCCCCSSARLRSSVGWCSWSPSRSVCVEGAVTKRQWPGCRANGNS